jgi:hypothetical protein
VSRSAGTGALWEHAVLGRVSIAVLALAALTLSGCVGAPESCHTCRHGAAGGGDGAVLDRAPAEAGAGDAPAGLADVADALLPPEPADGPGAEPPPEAGARDAAGDPPAEAPAEAGPRDGSPPDAATEAPAEGPPGLPPNLVAFYPFDQTSGTTAADGSGNGHTATLLGGATFGTGMVRNDLVLGTGNGYVDVPDHLLDSARALTITAWVKVTTDQAWQRVLDFGNDTNVNMFITTHAGATNIVRFAITTTGNAGEQHLDSAAALPVATWKHLAVVLGAAGGTLYIDGAPVTTSAGLTLRPADLGATVNNWIGRSQYAADPFFSGQIDEVRLYDRALTAAEVTTLFQAR